MKKLGYLHWTDDGPVFLFFRFRRPSRLLHRKLIHSFTGPLIFLLIEVPPRRRDKCLMEEPAHRKVGANNGGIANAVKLCNEGGLLLL